MIKLGEAATWQQTLPRSTFRSDDHERSARRSLTKSLQIAQAIGDRAGEAATFSQLGLLAQRMGRGTPWGSTDRHRLPHRSGHRPRRCQDCSPQPLRPLLHLGYDQAQFDACWPRQRRRTRCDRGRTLIERAFAEDPPRLGPANSSRDAAEDLQAESWISTQLGGVWQAVEFDEAGGPDQRGSDPARPPRCGWGRRRSSRGTRHRPREGRRG